MADTTDTDAVALCKELSEITFRLYLAEPTPEKLRHAARRCDIPAAVIRNRSVVEAATLASLGQGDFGQVMSRLRVPALVMEGAKTNVPLEATREWARLIPSARLLLIPEAGHELFVDQPALFLKATEQFLSGTLPR